MKNITGIFIFAFVFIVACNNSNTENSDNRTNLLLSSSVPVSQLFVFDTTNDNNWQSELKASHLIENLFSKVMKSEVSVFDPYSDSTKLSKESIFENMGVSSEPLSLNEIKSMYFEEEWFLDTTSPFLFEKKVNGWNPVRYYERDGIPLKRLVFKLTKGNPTELLAKNVIYEFSIYDTINPEYIKNIDREKLCKILVDITGSKTIKFWNPMNIEQELSFTELRQNLGLTVDTITIEDPETGKMEQRIQKKEIDPSEIQSIIFVEDWYYDPTTFAIKKIIKGIGPVRYHMKMDGEIVKSVAYMLYTGNEKTKIF